MLFGFPTPFWWFDLGETSDFLRIGIKGFFSTGSLLLNDVRESPLGDEGYSMEAVFRSGNACLELVLR